MEGDLTDSQSTTRPGYRAWLGGIVLLAALLRAALLIYADRNPAPFQFPDSQRYVRVARNIAAGQGPIESASVRAGTDPLFPYILSVGALAGFEDDAAMMRFGRLVNAMLGVLSVLLVAALARRLAGDRAALVSAAIMAVDPILLFFNALVLTETPYVTLLLASLWCVVTMKGQSPWGRATASGILIGLGTLTRSSGLFMPLILMPFVWHFAGGNRRPRIVAVGLFLVSATAALSPSAVRNYRLFGRLVPVRTGSGASLLEAIGPWADGAPGMDRIVFPSFPPGADECARDRLCREAALAWARENPGRTLGLAGVKLARTWSISLHAPGYTSALYTVIAWATVMPEFVLAFVGAAVMLARRPWAAVLLLMPAVYFALVHMVFVGSVRYRVPAMPLLFILAGLAVDRLAARYAVRQSREAGLCNV